MKETADDEPDAGDAKPDYDDPEAAAAPVADKGQGGVNADAEQGQGARNDGNDERRLPREDNEGQQRKQVAHHRGDGDDDGAAQDVGRLDALQVELLAHHRLEPAIAIRGDGLDHPIEQLAGETLAGIDIANLLTFDLRSLVDFGGLPRPLRLLVIALRHSRGVADCPHRDRFGDSRRKPGGEQDGVRAAARDHSEDDSQNVDEAVLTAKDDVAQPVGTAVLFALLGRGQGDRGLGCRADGSAKSCLLVTGFHRLAHSDLLFSVPNGAYTYIYMRSVR